MAYQKMTEQVMNGQVGRKSNYFGRGKKALFSKFF